MSDLLDVASEVNTPHAAARSAGNADRAADSNDLYSIHASSGNPLNAV
jgi:hypothetical protein